MSARNRLTISWAGPFSSASTRPTTRSASRTEVSSGVVMMHTLSAGARAFLNPCSIPAGESIKMKSKSGRSCSHTSTMSCGLTAVFSRLWAAGIMKSVSKRLSLIIACRNRQAPSTTLTKSYTMRFSNPITTSRLRSPMSASMTTTLLPSKARATLRLAAAVVLPTPPFPDVIVTTVAPISAPPSPYKYQNHVDSVLAARCNRSERQSSKRASISLHGWATIWPSCTKATSGTLGRSSD